MENDKLEIKGNNIKNTACKVFQEEKIFGHKKKLPQAAL